MGAVETGAHERVAPPEGEHHGRGDQHGGADGEADGDLAILLLQLDLVGQAGEHVAELVGVLGAVEGSRR